MFYSNRLSGMVADDQARSSLTGLPVVSFLFRPRHIDRRLLARQLCQGIGLAWVVGAIIAYPISQARLEREARLTLKQLGGRYHIGPNAMADSLPQWLLEYCGGEILYPVRSINLSHCDVGDCDLDVLLQFRGLEQVNLCGCPGVTKAGLAQLRRLPRLKLLWVNGMSLDDAGRCLTGDSMAAVGH